MLVNERYLPQANSGGQEGASLAKVGALAKIVIFVSLQSKISEANIVNSIYQMELLRKHASLWQSLPIKNRFLLSLPKSSVLPPCLPSFH